MTVKRIKNGYKVEGTYSTKIFTFGFLKFVKECIEEACCGKCYNSLRDIAACIEEGASYYNTWVYEYVMPFIFYI